MTPLVALEPGFVHHLDLSTWLVILKSIVPGPTYENPRAGVGAYEKSRSSDGEKLDLVLAGCLAELHLPYAVSSYLICILKR